MTEGYCAFDRVYRILAAFVFKNMSFNDNNMASSSKFSKDDDENKIKIENEDFTDSEYDGTSWNKIL